MDSSLVGSVDNTSFQQLVPPAATRQAVDDAEETAEAPAPEPEDTGQRLDLFA